MSLKLQGRLPYLFLVLAILILDRWTKAWIQSRFDLNESATVIDGFFNITYVRNTGVAFGTFSSISSPASRAPAGAGGAGSDLGPRFRQSLRSDRLRLCRRLP